MHSTLASLSIKSFSHSNVVLLLQSHLILAGFVSARMQLPDIRPNDALALIAIEKACCDLRRCLSQSREVFEKVIRVVNADKTTK